MNRKIKQLILKRYSIYVDNVDEASNDHRSFLPNIFFFLLDQNSFPEMRMYPHMQLLEED